MATNSDEQVEVFEVNVADGETFVEEYTAKKFHFFPRHDIMMLRQVAADRPFLAAHGSTEEAWSMVAQKLARAGLKVQSRTLRDRFATLLRKFRADEFASLRKSGTDEEYEEREILLTNIVELIDSAAATANDAKQQRIQNAAQANRLREAAMQNLRQKRRNVEENDDADTSTSSSSGNQSGVGRRSLKAVLEVREERIRSQTELERFRLENEAKRIRLDEAKLQLERERFDADGRMREAHIQMFATITEKLCALHK